MATLSGAVANLVDVAKTMDPDGKTASIAELLAQRNEILMDIPFMEGNLPTGHLTTVRTGLPTPTWRLMNGGVTPSKSTTAQITEACGMLEAWSEVDVDLAMLNGNTSSFRIQESKAFLEAMSQEFTQTLFYGNTGTDPEEFMGLSPRYNSLSAANAQNIVDAGGTGTDNASIWLACWGSDTVHGIFPKGSKAGLDHQDLGEQTVTVGTGIGGAKMRAFQDRFQWKAGLVLRDWRYAVRICNIDISNLVTQSSAADLVDVMTKAVHRIVSLNAGKCAFYMNRTCYQMLDIQRRSDVTSGGGLTYENVDGKIVGHFRNIPIRICDQLLETEARIT